MSEVEKFAYPTGTNPLLPSQGYSTGVVETAATAAAAHATASIQARYTMAVAMPRNLLKVRKALLDDCRRKGFADVAMYHLPRGGKTIPGFSIRFAEAARRAFTNMYIETVTVFDDLTRRIVRVIVTDLEAGLTESKDVTLDKVVERKSVKPGTIVLSTRVNSSGETVHLVQATEDELLQKEGALVSKAKRNLILAMIPGDILDEAWEEVEKTVRTGDADPRAAAKKLVDAFAGVGVDIEDLETYLGHSIDKISPQEVQDLRGIYNAIKQGGARWADFANASEEAPAPKALTKAEEGANALIEQIRQAPDAAQLLALGKQAEALPKSARARINDEYAKRKAILEGNPLPEEAK